MKTLPPKFITFEGIEGVGKSTAALALHHWLQQESIDHVFTREPGGTEIAEAIRHVLLQHHQETMERDTELLLMFAGRAQHLAQVILPALAQGKWVLCDRFTDASYAYQGGGRRIDFNRIALLENFVHPNTQPDLTFLLSAPVSVALQRTKARGEQYDRIEQETVSFFERVRTAYLERAKSDPARFRIIDATQSADNVFQAIKKEVDLFL